MTVDEKILFVVEAGSLEYTIPGGVQVCTEEIIRYLKLTSYSLEILPVKTTRRIRDRVKIKLGIDVYESFDFEKLADQICNSLEQHKINLVALNQIVFSPVIPLVKAKIRRNISFIGISHGNESGDYLHESSIPVSLKLWKVGRQILKEKKFYSEYLDGVIVISEHEVGVNQWLGATSIFVLPRLLKGKELHWQPELGVVGFVGTLNHGPNLKGLTKVLEELQLKEFDGTVRIVGGPGNTGEYLAKNFSCASYVGRLTNEALELEAKTWAIFLNPVFWYSRGSSTKLAQGLNWGLPSLTTPAGRRGYQLSDEEIVVKSHDPADFARAIVHYSRNSTALNHLHQSVEKNLLSFEPEKIANALEQFIRKTTQCSNPVLQVEKEY